MERNRIRPMHSLIRAVLRANFCIQNVHHSWVIIHILYAGHLQLQRLPFCDVPDGRQQKRTKGGLARDLIFFSSPSILCCYIKTSLSSRVLLQTSTAEAVAHMAKKIKK